MAQVKLKSTPTERETRARRARREAGSEKQVQTDSSSGRGPCTGMMEEFSTPSAAALPTAPPANGKDPVVIGVHV